MQIANSNLVIIPTRGRPENAERAVKYLKEHSKVSDIVLGLDEDDEHNYPRLDGVMYEVGPREYMIATLNKIAMKYVDDYLFFTFLGDDNIVTTDGWDVAMSITLAKHGYGIAYGNDMLQEDKLPTSIMITTNIVKALGFMAPPQQKHLYADNFWQALGKGLGSYYYFPSVYWEHLHFYNKKAEKDIIYIEANSKERYEKDRKSFEKYMKKHYVNDVLRVKEALGVNLQQDQGN
jgi:hypothetical protein